MKITLDRGEWSDSGPISFNPEEKNISVLTTWMNTRGFRMRWRNIAVLAATRTIVIRFSVLTGLLPMKYPDRISTTVTYHGSFFMRST
jgi:hypothetical protein